MTDEDRPTKPALNADTPPPQERERGLGTQTGAAQAGDQNVLDQMPERRGEVKYPDVENPDEQRSDRVPQEGRIEENPETVRDASPGAR
jgi:hypothetical protein